MSEKKNIMVNYNQALRQAKELDNASNGIKTEIKKVERYVNDLKGSWTGTNSDLFAGRINELKKKMNSSASRLTQLASALRSSAEAYRQAEMSALETQKTGTVEK